MKTNVWKTRLAIAVGFGALLVGTAANASVSQVIAVGPIEYSTTLGGPATVTVRRLTIDPGEVLAFHSHPGIVYTVVTRGTLTLEDGCGGVTAFTVGQAFQEPPGRVHRGKNLGTDVVETIQTFIVPTGAQISEPSGPLCQPCVADATTFCVNNSRYAIRTQWSTRDGRSGAGHVINATGDTGAFWFFSPGDGEVVVKVLNGCAFNSRYWTFAAGLTDVNVILTVTDTQTGTVQTYTNPQGTRFEPILDTNAFATCP